MPIFGKHRKKAKIGILAQFGCTVEENLTQEKNELKVQVVYGKCEVCGFEREICRFSRPVEGERIYIKDNTLVHEKRGVQQICASCLGEGIAKKLQDLFESPNDPKAREALKKIESILEKHGIKVVHKSSSYAESEHL